MPLIKSDLVCCHCRESPNTAGLLEHTTTNNNNKTQRSMKISKVGDASDETDGWKRTQRRKSGCHPLASEKVLVGRVLTMSKVQSSCQDYLTDGSCYDTSSAG